LKLEATTQKTEDARNEGYNEGLRLAAMYVLSRQGQSAMFTVQGNSAYDSILARMYSNILFMCRPKMEVASQGTIVDVPQRLHLKGCRTGRQFRPCVGQECEVSGPNCDNDDGYTWSKTTILRVDDDCVTYGSEGFHKQTHQWNHVIFRKIREENDEQFERE
jgi:hypothetical protein